MKLHWQIVIALMLGVAAGAWLQTLDATPWLGTTLSEDEVGGRFELVVGSMLYVIGGMSDASVFRTEPASDRETLERMVSFLAAGMRVPAGEPAGAGVRAFDS